MNLLEKYYSEPENYILEAGGGYGKSTSLKYLANILFEEETFEKKIIPVYIPMENLNFQMAQSGMLFDYLKQFFSNEVTEKALLEMISESKDNIHYLFLLDGLNELYNYEINGNTVIDFVCNDILRLLKYKNVNVIVSTRSSGILPEMVRKYFKLLVLRPLSNEMVSQYLEIENLTVLPGHIRQMLETPMLLVIFKRIYNRIPKKAVAIDNKYDLFELYFKQDFYIHTNELYSSHLLVVRNYVIEKILPFIAFRVESALLNNEFNTEKCNSGLLEEACLNNGYPENVNLRLVEGVMQSLGILDSKFCFCHELIRDYFAVKGFIQAVADERSEEVIPFLERLTDWLEYKNNQKDLLKRTKFLDLADLLYSAYKIDMLRAMKSFGNQSGKNIVCLIEKFYQELSGVYDDLSNGEEAARIGWTALEYLKDAEKYLSPFVTAEKYNFLYYVVKWSKDKKCYEIILNAKKILDEIDQSQRGRKYHDLYGKVLSNVGSYYYMLGSEREKNGTQKEADDMFHEAERWHQKSLDYRKEYCSVSMQADSFRTLMSDAYKLRNFTQGYEYYCDALSALTPNYSLEESMLFNNKSIPEDLVERAIGSELEILKKHRYSQLAKKILKDLPGQIQYIYEKSTEPGRKNLKMLESLEGKLDSLKKYDLLNKERNLMKIVNEYLMRCKSFH